MCRNIRPLSNFEPPATDDEIRPRRCSTSADQRHHQPSQANAEAFDRAVAEVAAASTPARSLVTTAPPKDREVEAAKARERAALRYATAV